MPALAPIRQGRTLSIMPTWKCTAECGHCGTLSSPRERTSLSLDVMLSAIDEAADLGYQVVVFTGGEPTLAGRSLLTAIRRAASYGMTTRIVTNCYWAAKDVTAKRRADSFVRAGLREINFSTGDQHARFVPVENVLRATRAAIEAGLRTIIIMVETVKDRNITKQTIAQHPKWLQLREDYPGIVPLIQESPWMPLDPRHVTKYNNGFTVDHSNLATRNGCTNVLTTTTLQANGSLGACCGLGRNSSPSCSLGA